MSRGLVRAAQQQGLPAFSAYKAVVHYGRYSSRGQQAGTSEERQIDKVDQWAASVGVAFTDRLIDRAASGFHGKHRTAGDFGSLLQQAKAGAIPTPALVVLAEGDRAGREDVDVQLESLVLGLLRSGVDLFVVDSGLHLNLERWRSDLGAQIQLQAILHGANQHSRRLSERMLDAHQRGREKVARGEPTRPGWAPSWITLKGDQWQFNSYSATVQRMLHLLQEHGYNATAKLLNAEGLKPPRGKQWTQGAVCNLVHSEAIAGGRVTLRRDPSSVVWDYYPALLERSAWHALLARIAARNGSPSHGGNQLDVNYIGQGVTVCAACGRPCGGRVASYKDRKTGERRQRRYVRCRGRGDGKCDAPALWLADVHAHLLTRLSLGTLSQLFPQQQQSQLTELQQQIADTQQQIEQQQTIAANGQQQITTLLATAPDAVPVVAQAVAAATAQVQALELQLYQQRQQLAAMESNATQHLAAEVQQATAALLQAFHRGDDQPADRRQLNQLFRRLDLRFTLDAHAQRFGIQLGDGAVDWRSIQPDIARIALSMGGTDLVVGPRGDAVWKAPSDGIDCTEDHSTDDYTDEDDYINRTHPSAT